MAILTQISEQKRRPNRRNIYLDGKFAFGCNLNVVAKFKLSEGIALSEQQVSDIQLGEVKQDCLDYALKVLERRLHSTSELSRKLTRHEYGATVIGEVIADLDRLGYLDDARFARTKALSAAEHKQHGKRRAMVELIKSGVKGDVARKALDDVYDDRDTLSVARKLAEKQAARLRKLDPQVARRRLVGMLQRRGFDYEDIQPVIESVLGRGGQDA
jgi:regulatory protein